MDDDDGYDLADLIEALEGDLDGKLLGEITPTRFHEDEIQRIMDRISKYWKQSRPRIREVYSAQADASTIENTLIALRDEGRQLLPRGEADVQAWVERVASWHSNRFRVQVKAVAPLDVGPLLRRSAIEPGLRASVRQGVDLIRDIETQTATRISRRVWETYERGESKAVLAKALREEEGFASRRARVVARDQLGKLTGNLDRLRQQEAGVDQYEWSTAGDDRVRREHADRNGERFKWSDPPPDGHPGVPILCRCRARAVIV